MQDMIYVLRAEYDRLRRIEAHNNRPLAMAVSAFGFGFISAILLGFAK